MSIYSNANKYPLYCKNGFIYPVLLRAMGHRASFTLDLLPKLPDATLADMRAGGR